MQVRIRLARWGARNNPFYGIVVANRQAPRDHKFLDKVGTYNPIPDKDKVKHIELNWERIKHWLASGAQPTDRVAWLLAKANLMPLTPKQLQRQGHHSLSDPKTWKVKVIDPMTGTETVYSAEEARQKLRGTPEEQYLPTDPAPGPRPRVPRDLIKLDGTAPKAPLTPAEILTVVQSLTGIR
ncbi:ribosomal protein S16 domain-containing protein [Zopfochytrium polystomum]|nr:ribosomal protein S16 domain-containing protein [Zopfochytrium polystomum]